MSPVEVRNRWVRTQEYSEADVKQKHGPFRKAIPVMSIGWASLCCVCNILLPGSGESFSLLHRTNNGTISSYWYSDMDNCVSLPHFPLTGTLISAFHCLQGHETEYESRLWPCLLNILCAILQFILTPLIIGWLWSVMWGIVFVNLARKWWVPRLQDRDTTFDRLPVRI